MRPHESSSAGRSRLPLGFAIGVLSLSFVAGCSQAPAPPEAATTEGEPTAIRWWSRPDRAALEPRATVDDQGRVWSIWIQHSSKGVSLQLACATGTTQPAILSMPVETNWVAAPDLTPFQDGVLCVWEAGSDSGEVRKLSARTATLSGNEIQLGAAELPLSSPALTPRVCRTGPDRVELICVSAEDPLADLQLFHLVRTNGTWSDGRAVLESEGDSWAPALAADERGRLHVVWDSFDGDRFSVEYAILVAGVEDERHALKSGAGYQAHPSIALTDSGAAWIAWEEAAQFGQLGGLRYERSLGLARVEEGQIRWATRQSLPDELLRSDFPQIAWSPSGLLITTRGLGPSFAASARKLNAAAGEDPEREHTNFRKPKARSRVYTDQRALFYATWWTRLLSFDEAGRAWLVELPQTEGDNLATESLVMTDAGPTLVFATDLRSTREPRPNPFEASIESLWRVGSIELPPATGFPELSDEPPVTASLALETTPVRELRRNLEAREGEATVYFGDLHRHTHLSRCAGSKDGITTDVYRYARGPGGLDFVAITDHFQHLQPWSFWRNQRDVVRFHAPGRLVAFSGVERASKERGHRNDIYLDGSAQGYEPKVWNNFPERGTRWTSPSVDNTISIPHMMGRSESPWRWNWMRTDLHRVFELYQGARGSYEGPELPLVATDYDVPEAGVGAGLARGNQFGFIAASDHGSTACGLAGVSAPELSRAAIFAAIQARQTFAATDFARVESTLGSLRGGEAGTVPSGAPLSVRARGAAPVATIEVFKNGAPWRRAGGETGTAELVVLTLRRYGPYPDKPMHVRLTNAELGSWKVRRRGELNAVIQRTTQHSMSVVKGQSVMDLVFEVKPDSADPTIEFEVGTDTTSLALAELPLGRTVRLGKGFERDQLWRIGPSLGLADYAGEFADPDRKPGDSYYARVVFEDGNVVWSSPIFVEGTEDR